MCCFLTYFFWCAVSFAYQITDVNEALARGVLIEEDEGFPVHDSAFQTGGSPTTPPPAAAAAATKRTDVVLPPPVYARGRAEELVPSYTLSDEQVGTCEL